MIAHNAFAVFRFELRRTLTASRVGVWLLLVLFPVFIVSVMKYYEREFDGGDFGKPRDRSISIPGTDGTIHTEVRNGRRVATFSFGSGMNARSFSGVPIPNGMSDREIFEHYQEILEPFRLGKAEPVSVSNTSIDDTVWGLALLGLIPGVTTLLGLLLWATPVVQADLEGRTWIYLAVRPRGRASVLFGRYLTAVVWTALAGWTSCTVCIFVAQPQYALRLWATFLLIIAFACFGYGALYSLIGVSIHRRAMVLAVAYTLIFEFLISFVPAVINQLTIQYRLRNLLVLLMDWRSLFPEDVGGAFLGDQPAWLHIALLCGFIVAMLVVAAQVIQRKEYVSADEA